MPPFRSERPKARGNHHTPKKFPVRDLTRRKRSVFQSLGFAPFPCAVFKGIEIGSHIERRSGGIGDGQIQSQPEIVDASPLRVRNVIGERRSDDHFPKFRLRIKGPRSVKDDEPKSRTFPLQNPNRPAEFFGGHSAQVGAPRSAIKVMPGDILKTGVAQIQRNEREA